MNKNIGHIIVCDEASESNEGVPILIKPLPMLRPISIPSNFSFSISVGFYNLVLSKNFEFTLQFISPRDEVIFEHKIIFEADEASIENEKFFRVLNLNCKNIELNVIGDYKVLVTTQDEEKELIIPVITKN